MKHHGERRPLRGVVHDRPAPGRRRPLRRRDLPQPARRPPRGVQRQVDDPRLRRRRPGVPADHQRADRDRRRDRAGVPDRRAADGHGDGPVPPDDARGQRAADHRGRPRRGRVAAERRRASGSWRRYAPNKLELASRDVVSRAEQTEINEGRGFPDGTVALDITKVPAPAHARGAARDRQHRPRLRRRRHHRASRSTSAPASTTSWAGSRPTSTAARRSRGCTPPARSRACRSTAATGSAPTRCSTR